MKSAVLSQQCNVTAFGEGFYIIVLQEGKSVIINLLSYITEEITACFPLNKVMGIFRNLDPINVQSMDRHITYT